MVEYTHKNDGTIDWLSLSGPFTDEDVGDLAKTISNLRQQGSTRLVLLGEQVTQISARKWQTLAAAMRNYRKLGGIILLAEFQDSLVKIIQGATWRKYVNIFKTREEASSFLDQEARH